MINKSSDNKKKYCSSYNFSSFPTEISFGKHSECAIAFRQWIETVQGRLRRRLVVHTTPGVIIAACATMAVYLSRCSPCACMRMQIWLSSAHQISTITTPTFYQLFKMHGHIRRAALVILLCACGDWTWKYAIWRASAEWGNCIAIEKYFGRE